jgi:uncharacterized phage infection (PIP) family protein YhgE
MSSISSLSAIASINSTLVADAIVAFLLIITIFYAAKLSQKLSALRADKAELQALVRSLTEASQAAEAGVAGLRAGAEDVSRLLAKKLQDAQSLREDLAYMIDRGGSIADQMAGRLRNRRETPVAAPSRPHAAAPTQPEERPRREAKAGANNLIREMASRLVATAPSRSERDLAQALAGRR